jgi:hypothetical protein
MDTLSTLQGLGLTLPTPAYIVGVILFSLLGMWAYYRGKRLGISVQKWLGLALMFYPYVVPQTWLLYVVGAALTAAAITRK